MPDEGSTERRIAALFLPELLCELADDATLSLDGRPSPPRGILLVDRKQDARPTDRLAAVDTRAFRAGVRPGMTPSEASAQLAGLRVEVLERSEVQSRLIAIAEVMAQYGSSPSWTLETARKQSSGSPPAWAEIASLDTVWLDVTGVPHLYGGERPLMEEMASQVRLLGHRVRLAIAPGPRIARAQARFAHAALQSIASSEAREAMAQIPIAALPLDAERSAWLARLGIALVGQLAQLPAAAASSRLGPHALSILELVDGIDRAPLVPGEFPRVLQEQSEWEEPMTGVSPLLFALHGLVARLSARLRGRGEACRFLDCTLHYDRAVARHRQVHPERSLEFELSTPLYKECDFERVLRARLERVELDAPTLGVTLRASRLSPQIRHQLGLSRRGARSFQSGGEHAQEFPVLLAELQSDVGHQGVGVLMLKSSLLPEERSELVPFSSTSTTHALSRRQRRSSASSKSEWLNPCPRMDRITRMLPIPQQIDVPLRAGESFALGGELFTIEKISFVQRLAEAHWWKERSVARDYHWAWLRSPRGGTEALLFFDRARRHTYVQALCD